MNKRRFASAAVLAAISVMLVAGPAGAVGTHEDHHGGGKHKNEAAAKPARLSINVCYEGQLGHEATGARFGYLIGSDVPAANFKKNEVKNTSLGVPFSSFVGDGKRHYSSVYPIDKHQVRWRAKGRDMLNRKFDKDIKIGKSGHAIVTAKNVCGQNPVVSEGNAGLLAISAIGAAGTAGALAFWRRRRVQLVPA